MSASGNKRPLSTHRAFPAVVALWFAALLGLGSFVVPPSSYEGLVQASGLANIIPAAAPPLGFTARLLISAAAALVGVVIGLLVATQIRKTRAIGWKAEETSEQPADEPETASRESVWLDSDRYEAQGPDEDDDFDRILSGGKSEPDGERDSASLHDEIEEQHFASPAPAPVEDVLGAAAFEDEDEEDDLERFAADRLVAGLPVVERDDLAADPVEDWFADDGDSPVEEVEVSGAGNEDTMAEALVGDTPGIADEPLAAPAFPGRDLPASDSEGSDHFDADFLSPHDEPKKDPETESGSTSGHREQLAQLPLADLVARLGKALAAAPAFASGAKDPALNERIDETEDDNQGDPVIAFLRREADREQSFEQAHPAPTPANEDPQTSLRNALERLDQVSRKS